MFKKGQRGPGALNPMLKFGPRNPDPQSFKHGTCSQGRTAGLSAGEFVSPHLLPGEALVVLAPAT